MKFRMVFALTALALTVAISAAGCEQVKDFSADSIQSLGSQTSAALDTVGDALGISSAEITDTPVPVPQQKVYEIASPKPTLTEEEKAAEKAKREEILKSVNAYFGSKPTTAPAKSDKDKGRKENKDKGRSGKANTPTPVPVKDDVEEKSSPTVTPTPVSSDALLDW